MTYQLWERIRDWVLLFGLLIISVAIMLAQNEPLVRSLRASSIEVTARIEARFAAAGSYLRALDENDVLRRENIELSSEVARSREAQIENERLRRMLGFQDTTAYPMLPARIVGKDITRQQNLLTIDVGRTDGVEVDMPVIDERGIIGKIVLVSENYARVMPYLNTDFRVPGRIQPIQAEGMIRWEGTTRSHLLMEFVSRTEPVLRGQLVVTSGSSEVFPAGLHIGFVDSVSTRPGRNELTIYIAPASSLDRAQYVFVLMIQPNPERLALERQPIR
jgi:rod shape-determining protein MreC